MPELTPEVVIPLVVSSYSCIFICAAVVAFFGFHVGETVALLFKWFLDWLDKRKEKRKQKK